MIKRVLSLLCLLFLFMSVCTHQALAVEDPTTHPNNKIGIHILFPEELSAAAKLVNSDGGDWGYVTIPIQSGDKDLVKWQAFMDNAKKLHVTPIIRLATEGDYFNTKVWRKPTYADVLDFANFLNSLNWPIKNRYIIVYNEVNRGDEWGGTPNPQEYAQILSYAVTAFKSVNPDFFIISAGLDNASINSSDAMNEYTFLTQMNQAVPGIFNQIDGLGSHSYPNPAFSEPPTNLSRESIASFRYEESLIQSMSSKSLPVFITETGWSTNELASELIGQYFSTAFTSVWSDNNVVAVTPFLLTAGAGPFSQFSFTNTDGSPNAIYKAIAGMQKIKGQPGINPTVQKVLAAATKAVNLPIKNFSHDHPKTPWFQVAVAHAFEKWLTTK